MTLADALATVEPKPVVQCRSALLLAALEPTEAAALARAIDDPTISAVDICRLLTDHGHRLSVDSIRRHRKRGQGGCTCPRTP
jgi:hypothetical protein